MGVEIEAQHESEVRQIRTRETQLENMDKLNNLTQSVNDIDLSPIESNTNDIKDLIITNLDDQIDLNDIFDELKNITKEIKNLKKSQTTMVKKVNKIDKQIQEG